MGGSLVDWSAVDADPLGLLTEGWAVFLSEIWEKKPHVFKATPARKELFGGLMTFKQLRQYATLQEEEGTPLEFGTDINAARYVNGVRETPNGDVADEETIKDLFVREGCTMQVHQPQRFVEQLWRLMAALERQLGCLVGCNAYLTPKHTQGLAPHYDDVEIFVVQTEGSKRWSIYRPTEGPYAHRLLANHCSGDLEEALLGPPLMEFILEVGDVLYMPRGTIHQARALSNHSSHLTISTYQRWAMGDLMQFAVSVALANPQLQPRLPAALRAGLPLRWVESAELSPADLNPMPAAAAATCGPHAAKAKPANNGSAHSAHSAARQQLLGQLAGAFRSMADWLEGEGEAALGGEAAPGHQTLLAAADAMAQDLMLNRLPPHPDHLAEAGPAPTLEDYVVCRAPGLFRLAALKEGDGPEGSDSDEESDGSDAEEGAGAAGGMRRGPKWVCVLSSLDNSRELHMMPGGEEGEGEGGEDGCCTVPECHHDHHQDHHPHGHAHGHHHGESSSDEEAAGLEGEAGPSGQAARKRRWEEAAGGEDSGLSSGSESGSDDEEDAESEDGEEEQPPRESLVFPAGMAPALMALLGAGAGGSPSGKSKSKGLRVADLPLPDDELKVDLAVALWELGALCTLPRRASPEPDPEPVAQAQAQEAVPAGDEGPGPSGAGAKKKGKGGRGKGGEAGASPASGGSGKGSGGQAAAVGQEAGASPGSGGGKKGRGGKKARAQ